jgi:hypothetical protein
MSIDAGDLARELGLKVPDLVAGFAGGLVNAIVFKRTTPWSAIGSVVVGALTANYLSEFIGRFIGTPGGAAAFITGLAGMAIFASSKKRPKAGL